MKRLSMGFSPISMFAMLLFFIVVLAIGYTVFSSVKERFASQPTITFYLKTGCGWCEKLKPELNKFEEAVSNPANKLNLKVVRSQDDAAAAEAAGIRGYPTIILTGGKEARVEYKGERTSEAMMAWVRENI